MTGILSINDIRAVLFEDTLNHLIVARDAATPRVVRPASHGRSPGGEADRSR